jgi:hypothetical protein
MCTCPFCATEEGARDWDTPAPPRAPSPLCKLGATGGTGPCPRPSVRPPLCGLRHPHLAPFCAYPSARLHLHVRAWWGEAGSGDGVPTCSHDGRRGASWRYSGRHTKVKRGGEGDGSGAMAHTQRCVCAMGEGACRGSMSCCPLSLST